MLVKKITHGFVVQQFDTETNKFLGQVFYAGDSEYENEDDEPIELTEEILALYEPFDMIQPEGA